MIYGRGALPQTPTVHYVARPSVAAILEGERRPFPSSPASSLCEQIMESKGGCADLFPWGGKAVAKSVKSASFSLSDLKAQHCFKKIIIKNNHGRKNGFIVNLIEDYFMLRTLSNHCNPLERFGSLYEATSFVAGLKIGRSSRDRIEARREVRFFGKSDRLLNNKKINKLHR